MLVERDTQLQTLMSYRDEAADGHGRVVFVSGEAGIGKSALVSAFVEASRGSTRTGIAYCDGSATPGPLAPLRELLPSLPSGIWPDEEVHSAAGANSMWLTPLGPSRQDLFNRLLAALQGPAGDTNEGDPRPLLLVVEDIHWADQATLDLLLFLSRRIHTCRALVIATYRSDDLDTSIGLRLLMGEAASATGSRRMSVPPLTPGAVEKLAERAHHSAHGDLYELTQGNAFYVTEVLASGATSVPEQCRDAILARMAVLSPAAVQALEIVALAGARVEVDLLEVLLSGGLAALDEALVHGMLVESDGLISFRHELARIVVEEHVTPGKRTHQHLHAALASRGADPARLAAHADLGGLSEMAVEHATAAAHNASALGAHREAVRQFQRALRHADRVPHLVGDAARADLFWSLGYGLYMTGRTGEAADAVVSAREIWERLGSAVRVGDAWRCLSRLLWFEGHNGEANDAARTALSVLERVDGPTTPQLAYAYGNMTQLVMLTSDGEATRRWGARTLELIEDLVDDPAHTELRSHALTSLGTMEVVEGDAPRGIALLEEGLSMARLADLHEHAARAYVNLTATALSQRRLADARRHITEGLEYCTERDLDSWTHTLLEAEADLLLFEGDLAGTESRARSLLDRPSLPRLHAFAPLLLLSSVAGRRGDEDPAPHVERARSLAEETGEMQRIAPVTQVRCELAWLAGRDDEASALALEQVELVETADCRWNRGAVLRWLAPADRAAMHREVAPPFAAELEGRWRDAADLWREIGCPFDEALALARSGEPDLLVEACGIYERLGAYAGVSRCRDDLRRRGRPVPRSPRSSTLAHPQGLTAREAEVAELLRMGLSDNEIADHLTISKRTAEHHVSSILTKLGVSSRRALVDRPVAQS
ncbi:ATP-binding protein [Knoellia subterranea]|nr:LuxR family transcriptional regulator [Knoellia subterranea]